MIKLIGAKRAMLLGVALALNLLIAAAYMFGIDPLRESEEGNLRAASGRISQLAQDTQNVKMELASFPVNYARYKDLGVRGFFSPQDRFEAGRSLDALREQARLLGYSYRIDAIKQVPDPRADAAGANLIDSRITLDKVSSALDTNIYALMRSIASSFPQHARIGKLDVRRVKELDENILQSMERAPVPLVEATIVFDWFTMVPTDSSAANPAQPAGFRGR